MVKVIFRQLSSALVTLFLSTIIIFILIRLAPGDPVELLLGRPGDLPVTNTPAYEERVQELRAELGLDQSYFEQYIHWLQRVLTLDLGTSIYSGRPVGTEIAEKIPATLLLSIAALVIQILLGMLFGIMSAVKARKLQDSTIRFICVLFASFPAFVVGLTFLSFFAVKYHFYEISNDASFNRLWLPAITLGLVCAPQLIQVVRANMLSEFGQTYIVSALSRGLSRRLIIKHAFRNALLPITTMIALSFATLIGGSIIIENIFSWPGIGNYALNSILHHDYPVIQGYTVIMVLIVIVINTSLDIMYTLLNPQIRQKGGEK
ncbi:sodium:proton antiporter [Bacillaceae bacterium SAS-127]|nr:sodium:proton antiporter [Bacillaceae bacterium SAS-127]